MKCPRDQAVLVAKTKGSLMIFVCPECNGLFIPLGQTNAKSLNTQLGKALKIQGVFGEIESPSTGKPMRHFTHRGVELDYCEESHSVWFDRGEYSKIFSSPNSQQKSQTQSIDFEEAVTANYRPGQVFDVSDVLLGVLCFLGDLF